MIISVNWLKQFTDITLPIDELVTLIGARLVEVEAVIDLGAKYKDVVVARVAECERMEGSDHLNVVKLDDGGKTPTVERDENDFVQVVCGAPNVREGLLVAWLPPESVVPETFGKAEPFILGARKLRGVTSNGMIASPRELDLYDDHTGILELDKELAPGESFAVAYELNDYLLDIENKSLTHRPDCFGIIGFAREVAAIQDKPFTTPEWLLNQTPQLIDKQNDLPITVKVDDPNLSNRYQAVVLSGANGSARSPLQIQTYLARVGVRPISAVVDVTNYLMLLTAQPLHAFDYDKIVAVGGGAADIHVRAARDKEPLKLIDGRVLELTPDDMVIAAGETAVALAGAMGGADTEIDTSTKTILLEGATFNLYNLRAIQMRHGIFSEAITRLTKGQPAPLARPVLAKALRLMSDFAGAKRASDIADDYPVPPHPLTIDISVAKVNRTLGINYTAEDMLQTLKNVEFSATMTCDDNQAEDGEMLHVTPPYWRADIHIPEDIIEEIGRLNGFDTIELTLPMRDFTAVRPSRFDTLRTNLRKALVRAGANEVLTYSFVHGDVLEHSHQQVCNSYRIVNSISPTLQYYRQTLTPSLLGAVHGNIKQGFDQFALFEINKVHPKQSGVTEEKVPIEIDMLALTYASKKALSGAPYYQAKKLLDYMAETAGLELVYTPFEADPNSSDTSVFEHRRSARVTDKKNGVRLGVVGEYKKPVARSFKLPEYAAGFEIGSLPLLDATLQLGATYKPLSRYPGTERDVCFQVPGDVSYAQLVDSVKAVLGEKTLDATIAPVDIYQPSSLKAKKNITLRFGFTSHDHTLTSTEVAAVVDILAKSAKAAVGATIV